MDGVTKRQRMQPMVAIRALRALIADPQDTPKVFEIIRALGGPSLERGLRRFRDTDFGDLVLRDDIDILDTLEQRSMLGSLPNGSFGSTYYHFTQREALAAVLLGLGLLQGGRHPDDDNKYDSTSYCKPKPY